MADRNQMKRDFDRRVESLRDRLVETEARLREVATSAIFAADNTDVPPAIFAAAWLNVGAELMNEASDKVDVDVRYAVRERGQS